jgi:enoyl-CoA hydratase
VDAVEAQRIGLVDDVVPVDQVLAIATAWAAQFVNGPTMALRAAKQAVDLGLATDLRSGLQLERTLFAGLFGTEDRTIGMDTFTNSGPGKAKFVGR